MSTKRLFKVGDEVRLQSKDELKQHYGARGKSEYYREYYGTSGSHKDYLTGIYKVTEITDDDVLDSDYDYYMILDGFDGFLVEEIELVKTIIKQLEV